MTENNIITNHRDIENEMSQMQWKNIMRVNPKIANPHNVDLLH